MIVVPTEVIRKCHYHVSLTSLSYFAFPRSLRRCFLMYLLTIQWQAIEIKVAFNEMSFEQSVTYLSAHQEASKWISLD